MYTECAQINTPDFLASGRTLLASEIDRCLGLLGRCRADLLCNDPVATQWLRAHIGSLWGQGASAEQVARFLKHWVIEGMQSHELDTRAARLAKSLPTQAAALGLLKTYLSNDSSEVRDPARARAAATAGRICHRRRGGTPSGPATGTRSAQPHVRLIRG